MRTPERMQGPLDVESQMVMGQHVSAESQTQVISENIKSYWAWDHLSRVHNLFKLVQD